MDKNEIIRILKDWNFWDREQNTGFERDKYTSRLREIMSTGHIAVVTGPRRAGKSYIMRQTAKKLISGGKNPKDILIVNLEDPRFTISGTELLEAVFKAYIERISEGAKPVLFLDEIQEVDGFEKWVLMMHELSKASIVISGSNAKLLSRELGTLLTGRHIDMTVFPLSFEEYLGFKGIGEEKMDSERELKTDGLLVKYLEEGAFPEVVLSEKKKEILLAYYDDVVNKDILRRYGIRKAQDLKAAAKFLFSNIAAQYTYNSLSRALGMSVTSAKNYPAYMEQAYLLFSLKRFSWKIKEQEKSPRKTYAIDTGLCNAAGFRFSDNYGRLAENAVFISLKKRQSSFPDEEIYYWKDDLHREADFVIKKESAISRIIQVCWDMNDEKTKKRELKGLTLAMERLSCENGEIITENLRDEIEAEGRKIRITPLKDFLLSEN